MSPPAPLGSAQAAERSETVKARPMAIERGSTRYFQSHYQEVRMEHQDNVDKVQQIIQEIEQRQPTLIMMYKTRTATVRLLLKQREQVELMLHEGVLVDLDARPIIADLNDRLREVYLESFYETLPCTRARANKEQLVHTSPLFQGVNGTKHRLASMLEHGAHAVEHAVHLPSLPTLNRSNLGATAGEAAGRSSPRDRAAVHPAPEP